MLMLVSAALIGFGLLLFALGTIRVALRLLQLVLLIILAGLAFASWRRRRRKVRVLEGEILPPERRTLRRLTKLLLFAANDSANRRDGSRR
jgi:hypothetical protein